MIAEAFAAMLLALSPSPKIVVEPPILPPATPPHEGQPNRFTVTVASDDELIVNGIKSDLEGVRRAAEKKRAPHKNVEEEAWDSGFPEDETWSELGSVCRRLSLEAFRISDGRLQAIRSDGTKSLPITAKTWRIMWITSGH